MQEQQQEKINMKSLAEELKKRISKKKAQQFQIKTKKYKKSQNL